MHNMPHLPVIWKQPGSVLFGVGYRLTSFQIGRAVERLQRDPLWSFALQRLHRFAFKLFLC